MVWPWRFLAFLGVSWQLPSHQPYQPHQPRRAHDARTMECLKLANQIRDSNLGANNSPDTDFPASSSSTKCVWRHIDDQPFSISNIIMITTNCSHIPLLCVSDPRFPRKLNTSLQTQSRPFPTISSTSSYLLDSIFEPGGVLTSSSVLVVSRAFLYARGTEILP